MFPGAQRVYTMLDRFVPSEFTDLAIRRRCQLVIMFAAIGAIGSLLFALTARVLPLPWGPIGVFAAIGLVNASVPSIINATKSVRLGANIVAAMWLAGVACAIYVRGSVDSPAAMAIAPLPLLVSVLDGWRSAIIWSTLAVVVLAIFALGSDLGLSAVDHVPFAARTRYALLSALTLLVVLVALAAAFLAMVRASEDSLAEAVRQRHAAENREQMLRAGRLAALGEVASSLAHEINNPLMYVMANVEFVSEDPRLPTDISEALRDARDGSERIASIVKDLKAYASSDESTIEQVDLSVVAQSTARLVRGYVRRRAQFILDFGSCPPIDGNWAQLGQVVINLVVNASHAIGRGDPENNEIRLETGVEDGQPYLLVADTGCGIASEDIDRVTEPFFTTGGGSGTGLGLTVTRNTVEELGGTISIKSAVGVGTSVTVRFPASPGQSRGERRLTLPATHSDLRVLVVDSDPLIAAAISRMLVEHDVVVATTLTEVGEQLEMKEPHLILLDVSGATGLGFKWYETLENDAPKLAARVVFLAGGTTSDEAEAKILANADRVVLKPVGRDRLRDLIYRFVEPGRNS